MIEAPAHGTLNGRSHAHTAGMLKDVNLLEVPMGRRPEDEIQKKLVELELSIKDEDAKRHLPAASESGKELSASNSALSTEEASMTADLFQIGGWACVVFGLVMFFSHIVVTTVGQGLFWGMPTAGAMGFLVVPLLVGIGMLFYNYKSRLAQMVTVGSLAAIGLIVINGLRLQFQNMMLLDFVIMGAPISLGCALLVKSHYRRLSQHRNRLEENK